MDGSRPWPGCRSADRDRGSAETPPLETFTTLTAATTALAGAIHERMPLMIPSDMRSPWLGEASGETRGDLSGLLRPCPPEPMEGWPVSRMVNSPRADDASLTEPITP